MKSVLISIRPKWCELIASGKKTIEVRKTAPKLPTPFKCYIYETKARTDTPTFVDEDGVMHFTQHGTTDYNTTCKCRSCGGFVNTTDNYCRTCGQAIDWSDEK